MHQVGHRLRRIFFPIIDGYDDHIKDVDDSIRSVDVTVGIPRRMLANYFYAIGYPTYSGYKIVHDPQWTVYLDTGAIFTGADNAALGGLLLITIIVVVAASVIVLVRHRRKRTVTP